MATKYHQISLKESFSDCQNQFIDDAPSFFILLSEYCDINDFIPIEFSNAFYQSLGRNRIYPLHGFLSAFILQKIFSIPTDALLLLFLNICKELRQFCGFSKVPDASLVHRICVLCKKDQPRDLLPKLTLFLFYSTYSFKSRFTSFAT